MDLWLAQHQSLAATASWLTPCCLLLAWEQGLRLMVLLPNGLMPDLCSLQIVRHDCPMHAFACHLCNARLQRGNFLAANQTHDRIMISIRQSRNAERTGRSTHPVGIVDRQAESLLARAMAMMAVK